ncbi:hypothetical protein BASA61_003840 [Batrachochytrium salamandrivorans]|nr:hypothetical protein BASA61_006357 [Batrachochytrium salamandrivorans]KAH6595324.1 hypothetical protein BASA61_003840 [Batrachochytrium salamandrivorans]
MLCFGQLAVLSLGMAVLPTMASMASKESMSSVTSMTAVAAILGISCMFPASVSSTVIGVDYGTDWLKMAMVKPGGVLETVLNGESKRKTAAVVNIRNGVRTYGSEAVGLGMRFPENTYINVKSILGKNFSHAEAAMHRITFPTAMIEDSKRNTIRFQHDQSTTYSAEELSAMLLAYAKRQAASYSGSFVSGAVITVPPYYSHFERQAILDAAEIADLKVFQLINDETAVAINYALGKKFPEPKYHIFYDMGAGSTIASLVYFKTDVVTKYGKNRTVIEVEVKAVSHDETLGGNSIDVRLQHYLATMFNSMNHQNLDGGSIYDSPRALARLLKEANRVKHILSANHDTMASVENLYKGLDFRGKIERNDLKMLCFDIIERVSKPLTDVLSQAKLTLSDIESVVLVGGSVRVPDIQAAIIKTVGEDKIARNVDGDEAAVHGAVFHSAAVSSQFRLGIEMKIKDLNSKPMYIIHKQEPKVLNGPSNDVDTELFTKDTYLGTKKLLTFKRVSDFEFSVNYKQSKGELVPIAQVKVNGVTAAMEKYKGKITQAPAVKVSFTLNESGILVMSGAQAIFELDVATKEKSSLKDTVLNFFSTGKGDSETVQEDVTNESEEEASEQTKVDKSKSKEKKTSKVTDKDATTNDTNSTQAVTASEAKASVVERVKLDLEIEWKTIHPLTKEEKKNSRSVLAAMDVEDRAREDREASRNTLESYLYRCKELVSDDDAAQFATSEEFEALKAAIAEQSEWLEDNSETAVVSELTERYSSLKKLRGKIAFRRSQAQKRPDAIAAYKAKLDTSLGKLQTYLNATHEDGASLYNAEDLESFKKVIEGESEWFEKTHAEQEKLSLNEDPVLKTKDLDNRMRTFELMMSLLNPIARPPKPERKTKTETTSAEASTTETASEEKDVESSDAAAESDTSSSAEKEEEVPATSETADEKEKAPKSEEPDSQSDSQSDSTTPPHDEL